MIMFMTSSRIAVMYCSLVGLMFWLGVACSAPAPGIVTPSSGSSVRLFTRTPVPTVTPTPTLSPQTLYQQGVAQRDAWELETALERYDAVLAVTPSASVYASRSEVYRLMGLYEDAAGDIESALALEPELVEAWRQLALLNRAEGKWKEALNAVNKVIELAPEDGAAYVLRAQVYTEGLGNIRQALADYERAISLDPILDKATLVERWHILAELQKWEEALLVSHKITTTGSEDPLRYFYRGWSLIQLGRLDDAMQMLFFGIKRYPDYPVALYYALGVAYYERQAWLEAIQALEVALFQTGASSNNEALLRRLGITSAEIMGKMGVAYLELTQCETGAAIVQRAITESVDPEAWSWAVDRIEACYFSLTPTPTPEETPTP